MARSHRRAREHARMVKLAALALLVAACQGHDSGAQQQAPSRKDAAVAHSTDDADPTDAPPPADEQEPAPDPGKLIADLGAIPAWEAVVARGDYLQRRNQHGIVYGVLGDAIPMPDPADDRGFGRSPHT